MTRRKAAFAAIVDDSDDENIDKITTFCNYCESLGFYYKLGPRIYPKDQPLPHDHDLFLQCYNCGRIENRVHAKQQNEIAPIVDPPDTIHDSNKVAIVTTHKKDSSHAKSRTIIDQIKKTRPGANRSRDYIDVDSDLRTQLSKGKNLISYNSTNDELDEG